MKIISSSETRYKPHRQGQEAQKAVDKRAEELNSEYIAKAKATRRQIFANTVGRKCKPNLTLRLRRHSGTLWITILQHDKKKKTRILHIEKQENRVTAMIYVCIFCKIWNFGSEADIQRSKILEQDLAKRQF